MPQLKLRIGGIYTLTDKREFIVCKPTIGAGYLLYQAGDRQRMGAPEYRVHEDGRLSKQGRVTHWRARHLTDTGRNVDEVSPASITSAAHRVSSGQQ